MTIGTSAVKRAPGSGELKLVQGGKGASRQQKKRQAMCRLLVTVAVLALTVTIGLQMLQARWQQAAVEDLSVRLDAVEQRHRDMEERFGLSLTPSPERVV